MSLLRLLLPGTAVVGDLDDAAGPDGDGRDHGPVLEALADLYAYPDPVPANGWVRANMVSSLDGSATADDGVSKSLGGRPDGVVFDALRSLADVVLVGAGTVRAERYRLPGAPAEVAHRRTLAGRPPAPVLAVVTRSGDLSTMDALFAPGTPTLVVTCADGDVEALRRRLGEQRVVVAGESDVDPVIAVAQLAARGLRRVLLEGGPHLLGRTIAAGRLDELCLTLAPNLLVGGGPRITTGDERDVPLRIAHLIECDGTLLGRWLVVPTLS